MLSIVQPGGASRPIPGPPQAFEDIAVSPDGQRIAAGIQTNPVWGDIWVGDLLGNFLPLTRDGFSHYAIWNARGDAVAFESRRSGGSQIIAQAIEGRAEPRVLFGGDDATPGTWLRDDLLVLNTVTAKSALREIQMLRPGEPQAERVPLSMTGLGRVSADGRWLAYISADSGEGEVYVTAFPEAGRVWPVSQAGSGRELRWSKSGSELYFKRRTGELMVVSVGANGPVTGPPRSAGVGTFPISINAGFPNYDTMPGGGFIVIRDVADRPAPAPIIVTLK
jgi:Tol biopolymer transport system component